MGLEPSTPEDQEDIVKRVSTAARRVAPAAAGLAAVTVLALVGQSGTAVASGPQPDTAQQIEQVMAQYVRDTDHRDGAALSRLFTTQGRVEISSKNERGTYDAVGTAIVGRSAIANAVTNLQAPIPVLGSEHHVTSDPVVTANGATAHLNVQFITWTVQGARKPAGGWPAGTAGAQGTLRPYEIGYYDADLHRVGGTWQFTALRIRHDLPIVIPGA